jgi:hypothetical protein
LVLHFKVEKKGYDSRLDIFVSYKTKRYANEAREVAHTLGVLGYEVWFDEDVLNSKSGSYKIYTKDQLIDILPKAVRRCRCSVVFEAELEKVMLPPGTNIEEECRKKTIMLTESGPIAWNWQKLEIDASSKAIAIHPSSSMIFVFDKGVEVSHDISLLTEPYIDSSMLLQRILWCLNFFGITPSRQT